MQSINTLEVSVFNATENFITQDTMDFAADILALAPGLEKILIGSKFSNDFYFDVTTAGKVSTMEIMDGTATTIYSANTTKTTTSFCNVLIIPC